MTVAEKPFFCFLSLNTPHTPMQAKEEDLARFSHIRGKRRQTYAAMQWCMDLNIGKILAHLKTTKQIENTLIVFYSDNGGSVTASHACNAPLNGMKGSFLEGRNSRPFYLPLAQGSAFRKDLQTSVHIARSSPYLRSCSRKNPSSQNH